MPKLGGPVDVIAALQQRIASLTHHFIGPGLTERAVIEPPNRPYMTYTPQRTRNTGGLSDWAALIGPPKEKGMWPGARAPLATIFILLRSALLVGCATGMRMSAADLQTLGPDDGIVVGSFLVKGGQDILGRKRWKLVAERLETWLFPSGYAVEADRDGREVIFVAKMPAGAYHFYKLVQPGFSSFRQKTDIVFQVQPGRTIYIGRLVLAFPPGRITILTRFQLNVEDARATSISGAESEYGVTLSDVLTSLMSVANWPQSTLQQQMGPRQFS